MYIVKNMTDASAPSVVLSISNKVSSKAFSFYKNYLAIEVYYWHINTINENIT